LLSAFSVELTGFLLFTRHQELYQEKVESQNCRYISNIYLFNRIICCWQVFHTRCRAAADSSYSSSSGGQIKKMQSWVEKTSAYLKQ
jgi:hypothetical protein